MSKEKEEFSELIKKKLSGEVTSLAQTYG